MTNEEISFYKNLYRVINDPVFNDLLTKYAKKEHEKALNKVRSKQDTYDYGYNNGQADAWNHIMTLKTKLLDVMKNIGV